MTMSKLDISICGLNAVKALFEVRPNAIHKLFFSENRSRALSSVCKYIAKQRKLYRLVPSDELENIAGTEHHGGVVAVADARPVLPVPDEKQYIEWSKARQSLLLLDGIGNHHNLGAIVRTAAYFGFNKIILSGDSATPSASTYRTAEGGMEHVDVYQAQTLLSFCSDIRKHYLIVGTSLSGIPLSSYDIHKFVEKRPVAIVLGNEEKGISWDVKRACHSLVTIPGTGKMQSLNVSAACAVLMFHFAARQ